MATDLEIIKQLEQEIGIKLEKKEDEKVILESNNSAIGYKLTSENKVRILNLSFCGLSDVPNSVFYLQNLEVLILNNNNLTTIPNDIERLYNLISLKAAVNKLLTLPYTLGSLGKLYELDLNANRLKNIPKELGRLQNLNQLYLGGNRLKTIPVELSKLHKLKELGLAHNQLQKLPKELGKLDNSCKINLENNPLEIPPIEIAKQGIKAIRGFFNNYPPKFSSARAKITIIPAEVFVKKIEIKENQTPTIGVEELAKELAELIDHKSENERYNIGILGKWGRGKTFLIEQIKKYFKNKEEDNPFHIVEFHAWRYQDTPAIWAYLYEIFADEYYTHKNDIITKISKTLSLKNLKKAYTKTLSIIEKALQTFVFFIFSYLYLSLCIPSLYLSSLSNLSLLFALGISLLILYYKVILNKLFKLYRVFRLNLKKHTLLPIILSIVFVCWFFMPLLSKAKLFLSGAWYIYDITGITILGILGYYLFFPHQKARQLINKYFSKHSFQTALGIQAEILKELQLLLETWIPDPKTSKKRILLIVDDIDRCSEDKIIDIVDALRVMLEDEEIYKRVVVISAIDEEILKRAIKIKYEHIFKNEINEDEKHQIISEYMDKLFLISIKLHQLTNEEKLKILDVYTEDKREKKANEPTILNESKIGDGNVLGGEPHPNNGTQPKKGELSEKTPEESKNKKKDKIDSNKYEISDAEYQELCKNLEELENATPRKIRIIYYRYLLAKKLLSAELHQANGWQENSEELKQEIGILSPYLIQFIIKKPQSGKLENTELDNTQSQILSKIIDIVVAY
ncbi:P-loop NTPase fold protein [Candidatus Albibeggiatoa sp. nov. NOAA]|uniref:P-loop NTPase fold protein n=1 Tax=Candidatus Albibeggiatoa sp. nov. NOAA TaxID=3162724 RepID=UPI0032FC09CE|nr:P-loop NTPase fold protein [Thiotrichaceae bacterium]